MVNRETYERIMHEKERPRASEVLPQLNNNLIEENDNPEAGHLPKTSKKAPRREQPQVTDKKVALTSLAASNASPFSLRRHSELPELKK